MNLIVKALLTFLKFKPAVKLTFGPVVILELGKTIGKFPNLPFTLIALQALHDALTKAVSDALIGGNNAKDALKTAIKNWNVGFKSTAEYVTFIANGDAVIISGAGFTPSKSSSIPSVLPLLLVGFKFIGTTVKGVINAWVNTAADSIIYVFVAAPPTVTVLQTSDLITITIGGVSTYLKISTSHSVTFEGLPSQQPINVTAFGVNNVGIGPMTAPVITTPQ